MRNTFGCILKFVWKILTCTFVEVSLVAELTSTSFLNSGSVGNEGSYVLARISLFSHGSFWRVICHSIFRFFFRRCFSESLLLCSHQVVIRKHVTWRIWGEAVCCRCIYSSFNFLSDENFFEVYQRVPFHTFLAKISGVFNFESLHSCNFFQKMFFWKFAGWIEALQFSFNRPKH